MFTFFNNFTSKLESIVKSAEKHRIGMQNLLISVQLKNNNKRLSRILIMSICREMKILQKETSTFLVCENITFLNSHSCNESKILSILCSDSSCGAVQQFMSILFVSLLHVQQFVQMNRLACFQKQKFAVEICRISESFAKPV